jgi:2-hydroxy-6-oxonona-2,4-dienedioate hydrolase
MEHTTLATSLWPELMTGEFSLSYLQAGPIRTRVLRAGTDGEPLLLLHGVGGHLEAYQRNVRALAEHFQVAAIDMIGHGFTDKPDRDYEIDDYIGHVSDVIDSLGFGRVSISGESLGGWVAAKFAARYPERVNKIVLNTAGGLTADPAVMARIKETTMNAVRNVSYETVKARLEWLMHDKTQVTPDLIETRYAIYSQPGFVETMERIMCMQQLDIRKRNMITEDELHAIQAETLVLWTSHDPTGAVEVGERFARSIANARLVVMDNCGHWPQWEDVAGFNDLHVSFLKAS